MVVLPSRLQVLTAGGPLMLVKQVWLPPQPLPVSSLRVGLRLPCHQVLLELAEAPLMWGRRAGTCQ